MPRSSDVQPITSARASGLAQKALIHLDKTTLVKRADRNRYRAGMKGTDKQFAR
jgi:hypothetical protein